MPPRPRCWRTAAVAVVLVVPGVSILGQETQRAARGWLEGLAARKRLTGDWDGARTTLEQGGIKLDLGLTSIWQRNWGQGRNTHNAGRITGSWDLEGTFDLGKLAGLKGGRVYCLAEGSWGNGIDAKSVGSLLSINHDVGGDRSIDVSEFWYQQNVLDDRLKVRVGKMDLTGGFTCRDRMVAFDGNQFAVDETSQFLANPLVNNPAIPFPKYGLGIAALVEPIDRFYLAAAVADAEADSRETGFATTFGGPDHFFSIYEAGVVPDLPNPWGKGTLAGMYAVGLWYDPRPKQRIEGGTSPGTKRDDMGFYVTLSQEVWKEKPHEKDNDEGLGVFARYGFAPKSVNPIEDLWSVGCQYKGLIPGRDNDTLGFGVAQGVVSRRRRLQGRHPGRETLFEWYYNIQVIGSLNVTLGLQVVDEPGGLGGRQGIDDATVGYIRLQQKF